MTEEEYLDIAAAILDGTPVSWDTVPEPGTEGDRGCLQQLRLLADLRRVHRDAHSPVGTTWGPLLILEPLGIGTFGDVYKARDTVLDRDVALKLLRSATAGRHVSEGRALARVRHPNVVTVFGAADHNGRCGIWMEFIQGETLAQLVAREGPLDAAQVTAFGLDIARALDAVHASGLLHGDIKAQNVMREHAGSRAEAQSGMPAKAGRIALMDFGTGRVADDATAETMAGTPLYIAPEVLSGAAANPSSDIYGIGVLLYFLLTGTFPITGRTLADVRAAHAAGWRTPIRERRPDVPRSLAAVVDRATSPQPAARFETASALEDALAKATRGPAIASWRMAVATVLIAVSLTGLALWAWPQGIFAPRQSPIAFQARDWVLITAFDNRTGDKTLDRVVESAIERELANSGFVNVVSRVRVDDTLQLMKRPVDSHIDTALGREIWLRDGDIRALLSGRIERIGQTYVLSAGLVDPGAGVTVVSITEEASTEDDLVRALRRLSNQVREALGEASQVVRTTDRQLEKVTTPSLQALRLFSEAYVLGDRSEWAAAAELARQAIAIDPEFASAHIWLAWALRNMRRPQEEVEPIAARALELADRTADHERYWIIGSYHSMRGEHEKAAAAYEVLLRLHPDHPWAATNLITARRSLGQRAGFGSLTTRLADARPNSLRHNLNAMFELMRDNDFERARQYVPRVRALAKSAPESPAQLRLSNVWFFDAEEAWFRKDAPAAAAAMDAAARDLANVPPSARDMFAFRYMHYALALGRPQAADDVAQNVANEKLRQHLLAVTSFARGDATSARDHSRQTSLQPVMPGLDVWNLTAWLKIRAGLRDVTRAAIDERGRPTDATLTAEIMMAAGQTDRAIDLLRDLLTEPPVPNFVGAGPYYRGAVTLAKAYVRRGDSPQAADLLRRALARKDFTLASEPYWGMCAELTLAELEAEMGHTREAVKLIDELSWMLAAAEPDFPLLVRLQRLRTGIGAGPR